MRVFHNREDTGVEAGVEAGVETGVSAKTWVGPLPPPSIGTVWTGLGLGTESRLSCRGRTSGLWSLRRP